MISSYLKETSFEVVWFVPQLSRLIRIRLVSHTIWVFQYVFIEIILLHVMRYCFSKGHYCLSDIFLLYSNERRMKRDSDAQHQIVGKVWKLKIKASKDQHCAISENVKIDFSFYHLWFLRAKITGTSLIFFFKIS